MRFNVDSGLRQVASKLTAGGAQSTVEDEDDSRQGEAANVRRATFVVKRTKAGFGMEVTAGFGRIVALNYCSSALHQIHS